MFKLSYRNLSDYIFWFNILRIDKIRYAMCKIGFGTRSLALLFFSVKLFLL